MIKTNELRVCNFVSLYNGFKMRVHSIFQNDTVYLDFIPPLINKAGVWEQDCKDLVGIQLTEEWLLKFGAIKYEFNHKASQYRIDSMLFVARENVFFDYGTGVKLQYVHQLQNLYFALHYEELVFSTEP